MKLLNDDRLPFFVRTVGEFLEGVSKPVGGDEEAVFGLGDRRRRARPPVPGTGPTAASFVLR